MHNVYNVIELNWINIDTNTIVFSRAGIELFIIKFTAQTMF